MRRSFLTAAVVLVTSASLVHADRPEWESVRGVPIAAVRMQASEVFDPSSPGQDYFFLEWANTLHIVTRPHVLRREFDQRVGDPFDPQRAEECERNLKSLGIFQEARVVATRSAAGVDVALCTVDRWSLSANPVLQAEGGVNEIGLAIGDRNVLGLGFELGALGVISNDVDRAALRWRDRRVLGTRWDAALEFQYDDLTRYRGAGLAFPFHSDAGRWTSDLGVALLDGEERIFESGEETARFDVHEDRVESAVAIHAPGSRLGKLGLFQTWRRVRGDATSDVAALGVFGALLSRESSYRRHVDQFGPDEEISQGWTLQVGLGADLIALGATRDRLLYRAEAAASRFLGDDVLCGAVARHHAFVDRGGALADGRLTAELYGFWAPSARAALAWRVGGDALLDERPYARFDLGSDDRLRGYEARALNGTRVLYGGLEQRLFASRRVSFLRLGAVAFVDAAAAWDEGEVLDTTHARLAGGVGLRLGTDPTGSNVTRVDIGFGTNSIEIAISSGSFFTVGRTLAFPSTRLFQ